MTTKEKANILIERFYQQAPEVFGTGKAMEYAKQCALICVDEMLEFIDDSEFESRYWKKYWDEVKQEIERL